ncbi:SDR family NAD(P)-dependent oxidoreductase [Methylobacterium sp. ARG-1]|uniref:SDR family NAD(P)-dependent oxidoreductase n=1 Tax=Methylobacterium sp. ARG-1 TaxID=1692501 RepID=UPI000A7235B7
MATLMGKTLFITGASRGIGRAIALRSAADGANVAIVVKTSDPHSKLPGTIHSVAAEVEAAGGSALPLAVDIRDDSAVDRAAHHAAEHFGGIDIVVNNASAIALSKSADISMRRFDLMFDINARGTFAITKACLPYLKKAENPHVLTLSPP